MIPTGDSLRFKGAASPNAWRFADRRRRREGEEKEFDPHFQTHSAVYGQLADFWWLCVRKKT